VDTIAKRPLVEDLSRTLPQRPAERAVETATLAR